MTFLGKIGSGLRQFFREVARSCYDMEFYRDVRQRPWQAALRYVALVQACVVLAATLLFAPFAAGARSALVAHLRGRLPDGASFRFEKGRLDTTVPAHMDIGAQGFPVIVDTTIEGVTATDQAPDQGMLVGKDAVFMANGRERKAFPFADMPDASVTKADLLAWLDRWSGPFLAGGIALLAIFWYAATFVGTAAYVAIGALAATFAGRLFEAPLRYRQWVAVGFHAVTLPMIVNAALGATGIAVPYAYSFIFFMFVAATIADERSRPTAAPEEPPPRPSRRLARRKHPSKAAGPPAPKDRE